MREGALDHVAALIGDLVERWDFLAGWIGLDDRGAAPRNQEFAKLIAVVGGVGQHLCGLRQLTIRPAAERTSPICPAVRSKDQSAGSIGGGMDLSGASTAAASDRLFLAPPFP